MKIIVSNRLRGVIALFMCLLLQPAPELWAHTKKGDKLLKLGEKAEANKEYEKALEYYTQALESDPEDPGYQLHARQMRFQASQLHVTAGQKLRNAGRLQDALVEFDHAYATDPSSAVAIQEIQRTTQMIERNRNENLTGEDAKLTPVELARQKQLQRIDSLEPAPELKPITNQISTLKMNNQPPRVLYETVGKLAGINVIFDPQYQTAGKNVNLDLTNTTLEQALDYIATLTKTFWKPISSNTIFVAEDSVTKRRDYQDEEVKVFYLKNVTSAQEFQEIITAVRSITDIRRMFSYAPLNAVICRASVDQMALAAKLFHDLDKPKAEVVIDVMVMSVNTDRTRNLAMGLVSGGTTGLVLPIGFAPRGATTTTPSTGTTTGTDNGGTTGTGITGVTGVTGGTTTAPAGTISLGQLGKLGFSDFNVTLPGALLQAVATDNQTRVLQSPELRASDGQKATLKIGQRIPYATGSYQPGIGTVGVSPLVSTQFNFADTGVNVELTPHVHGTDELTLHVVVDLSSVATYANIGGIQQPVIAQQKNEAEIRLRDGEVSLLGGLSQDQNTNNLSGLPGIVNIPVLGGLLFGSQTKERTRQELLIALVPHIVRTPDVDAVDLRGVASGTDQEVKVSFQEAPPAPAQAPAAPVVPAPAAAPPNGAAALSFAPGAIQIPLSGQATVTIEARNMTDLSAAPLHLKWDPKLLRLNSVTPGALIGDGGPQANPPSIDIRNDTGEASITLTRAAGAPGVNGSGGLAVLQFTAIGKGTGTVAMTGAALKNSKQQAIPVSPPLLAVTVQ